MHSDTPCDCKPLALTRTERSMWMRLFFPDRRLYVCTSCRQTVFADKRVIDALIRTEQDSTWKGMAPDIMAPETADGVPRH